MSNAAKYAEYVLLYVYDEERKLARHDYGAGQRWRELTRLRRELGDKPDLYYVTGLEEAGTPAELVAAFERIGRPRIRRIVEHESYRRATPSSRRTVDTWRKIELRVMSIVRAEVTA